MTNKCSLIVIIFFSITVVVIILYCILIVKLPYTEIISFNYQLELISMERIEFLERLSDDRYGTRSVQECHLSVVIYSSSNYVALFTCSHLQNIPFLKSTISFIRRSGLLKEAFQ